MSLVQLKWEGDAGSIQINGTDYFLDQGHWHSPSEHSINGRRYDLELHMVHLARDPNVTNKIAVVGLFYKIGHHDDFLSKLMSNILSMTDKKDERNMGVIDPREIKMGGKKYYRYMGSLTVPPCTEGVIWAINKKIRTVSREQVKSLRVAVHDLMSNILSMTDKKDERNMGVIDPREIKMGGKKYYRYMGSLTVPPCTEGVIWTMNKKIRTVSREQVKSLRVAVHDYAEKNARPVQQLNNREIHFYGPNPTSTRN
ncbi:alpha carbonic anhydrase 4 [Quercus suber]|uniref:Carbonic anhydrase n=1 Tax=Quercus suber TaxID=58331 RepID=A0AAW0IMQ7_QUESU